MNALYVTVSIPLLLILAGFNHAHGLTTFGKSNNQQQPQSQPPIAAKTCGNHTHCRGMEGTSCVPEPNNSSKKRCLCGNNQPPANGVCTALEKGPNHTCNVNSDCVKGAECMPLSQDNMKVCKCTENPEFNYDCNGSPLPGAFWGLVALLVLLPKTLLN